METPENIMTRIRIRDRQMKEILAEIKEKNLFIDAELEKWHMAGIKKFWLVITKQITSLGKLQALVNINKAKNAHVQLLINNQRIDLKKLDEIL